MKRCPECRRDYFDDSLLYCLDDGTALLEGPASEVLQGGTPTEIMSQPTMVAEAKTLLLNQNPKTSNPIKWIAIAVLGLGVISLAAFLFFQDRDRKTASTSQPKLSQLTFADAIEEYPVWSPDVTRIAYSGEVGGVRKIFIKGLDSSEETQLTRGEYDEIQPSWSPDGRRILFVRAQRPNEKLQPSDVFGPFDAGDIWSVDVETRAETKIIENAFNPAFSPDGTYIAYDASRSGPRRIWMSDSSGYNPQQISTDTSEDASHVRPRWSSDGKRIVFQNIERTKFNARTVELDGRKMTWITNDLNNNLNPVWSQKTTTYTFPPTAAAAITSGG
jgi:Tol biopolymer transport system component